MKSNQKYLYLILLKEDDRLIITLDNSKLVSGTIN